MLLLISITQKQIIILSLQETAFELFDGKTKANKNGDFLFLNQSMKTLRKFENLKKIMKTLRKNLREILRKIN